MPGQESLDRFTKYYASLNGDNKPSTGMGNAEALPSSHSQDEKEQRGQHHSLDAASAADSSVSQPGQSYSGPDSHPGGGNQNFMVVDTPTPPAPPVYPHSITTPTPPQSGEVEQREGVLERIRRGIVSGLGDVKEAAEIVRNLPWDEIMDEVDKRVGGALNRVPGVHLDEYDPPRDPNAPPLWLGPGEGPYPQLSGQTQNGWVPDADLEPTQGYTSPTHAPQWNSAEE